MMSKYKKMAVACVLSLFILIGPSVPIRHAEAETLGQHIPTFGLYCQDQEVIKSGAVKFDLSDSELFSKQKAIKESEYHVSGNQTVTFEIPFFSSYIEIPPFNVTVGGQAIEGEVWYGDNEVRYGGNNSYLDAMSADNSMLEQQLKRTYSPILDETVIGTLYTVIPEADDITVSLKLEKPCSFVYDGTNLRTESYSADGTQVWIYENALSQPSYQYFFIGENTAIDFSTICEYHTEAITFKDFIDRNYNKSKEFYEQVGAPIAYLMDAYNNIKLSRSFESDEDGHSFEFDYQSWMFDNAIDSRKSQIRFDAFHKDKLSDLMEIVNNLTGLVKMDHYGLSYGKVFDDFCEILFDSDEKALEKIKEDLSKV